LDKSFDFLSFYGRLGEPDPLLLQLVEIPIPMMLTIHRLETKKSSIFETGFNVYVKVSHSSMSLF